MEAIGLIRTSEVTVA